MRKYKTGKRMTEYTDLVSVTCDLCGRVAEGGDWETAAWHEDHVEVRVVVTRKEGCNFPDNGSGTEYVVDLCPQCFVDRLIAWLRSQGAQIEERKWEW